MSNGYSEQLEKSMRWWEDMENGRRGNTREEWVNKVKELDTVSDKVIGKDSGKELTKKGDRKTRNATRCWQTWRRSCDEHE